VTTFDRYLLSRYFHVFAVFFVAAMGLYVVADGFTNLDGFQRAAGEGGATVLLAMMGKHYLYHSSLLFELAGPTLAVMSTMCVLALTLKHGELHPLLAAGVPTYRVAAPLVVGVLTINALLTGNQEWIIPRIAQYLQGTHGDSIGDAQAFEPTYDTQLGIFISGKELVPKTRTIHRADFLLPVPLLSEAVIVHAEEALYVRGQKGQPSGWLLKSAQPRFEQLRIAEAGVAVVLPHENPSDVFIRSELTFDQLSNRGTGYRYLSTSDLVWRIRHPSAGMGTRRAQILHLHERLTRPIITLIGLFLVVPMIARRERLSLVTNVAVCMGAVGCVYALAQGMLLFGNTGLLAPALCAWLPLICGGSLGAWLSPLVRT
jgi:lipopolysaccharide export system permease protein